MTYVLDGLMIVLIALCVWAGYHRGFVRTVGGLIALIVAVLAATVFSGPLSKSVYTNFVQPQVLTTLEQQIEGEALPSAEELDTALQSLPPLVTTVLEHEGLDSGAAILRKVGETGEPAAETITRKVITPVVLPLIQLLCSVILFALAYILTCIVVRALNVVTKLPLLKQANNVLGLFAGAINGCLWVLFAVRVLYALALLDVAPWLTTALLEDTMLVAPVGALLPVGA